MYVCMLSVQKSVRCGNGKDISNSLYKLIIIIINNNRSNYVYSVDEEETKDVGKRALNGRRKGSFGFSK